MGPLLPNEVSRIAQHVRKGKGREIELNRINFLNMRREVEACFSNILVDLAGEGGVDKINKGFSPSYPSFLPSSFLTCCAILPTSFGGKGPHLRPSSDGLRAEVVRSFLSYKEICAQPPVSPYYYPYY